MDPSIVSQTVTVRHHPSLPESTLSRALGDAGFEIYDMVRDAETEFIASDGSPNENALVEQDGWIDRAVEIWSKRYNLVKKRKCHYYIPFTSNHAFSILNMMSDVDTTSKRSVVGFAIERMAQSGGSISTRTIYFHLIFSIL